MNCNDSMKTRKILILYYSQTGNTEKMAKAVMRGINKKANTVELKYFSTPDELAIADAILVGVPTYNGTVPISIEKLFKETITRGISLKGKIGAAFGSFGWSGEAPSLMLEEMEKTFQMNVYKPVLLVKDEPSQQDLDNCIQFGLEVLKMVQ